MKTQSLSAVLLTLVACSSAPTVDHRNAPGAASKAGQSQSSGTSTPGSPGSTADAQAVPVIADVALQALIAKHDACSKSGQAWVPQLDAAKLAANPVGECGAPLVKWCCSLPAIQGLFSGPATELAGHVQPLLDKKFQIYDCSQETADQVKVHLLKFDGAAVNYTDLTLGGLLAAPASAAAVSCLSPNMNVVLKSTGEAAPPASTDTPSLPPGASDPISPPPAPGQPPAPPPPPGSPPAAPPPAPAGGVFSTQINPILANSCGGGSCHGSGSPLANFVDHEDTVKNNGSMIISKLQAGAMPVGGKTISKADKATLIKFLSP